MRKPQLDAETPRLLAGRYQLFEQVAAGAMASVWRGHDQVLGRDVAVKLLHAELAEDADFSAGFRAEAVNAANLNHPSIVGIFDIGEHEGVHYLVMELVEGASLREALADTGPLTPAKTIQIGARVAGALAYAHRAGVLHRNVKPTNILLTPGGGVKVTDFSIARPASAEDASRTAELLGGGYLAPEQLRGDTGVDPRTDVYALGACMYEMLTGQTPSQAAASRGVRPPDDAPAGDGIPDPDATIPPPRSLRNETPADLEALVLTALDRDPDRRFQNAQALARALVQLATVMDPEPTEPPTLPAAPAAGTGRRDVTWPPPDPSQPRQPRRFRLAGALLGVLVLVALVAIAANGILQPTGGQPREQQQPTTTARPAPEPVGASAVSVLDPSGDGENDELLPHATDGDPATTWRTESYSNERFGLLKPGLGLIVQVPDGATVREIALQLTAGGGTAEIRGGDEIATSLEDWAPLTEPQPLQEQTTFSLEAAADHPYYLIWFSTLPPRGDGSFRAEVAEVELRS